MTDAMRDTLDTGHQQDPSEVRCPICESLNQTDFFEMPHVPVDTCMLWDSREGAANAKLGDIVLSYCGECGFVFNRIYDQSLVSFEPGYEASLAFSQVFTAFQEEVATRLIERYELRNKTIVEIGCGAGDFLRLICRMGGNRGFGFDPALEGETVEHVGRGTVQLIPDYYSTNYKDIEPDFICCLSVFEDIPRPVEFLEELKRIIGDARPVIYFEIFNAFHAFEQGETWSIHYEQCNYFGLKSFTNLFERCGFKILDANKCYEGDQYLSIEAIPSSGPGLSLHSSPPSDTLPHHIASFATRHRESMQAWRERMERFQRQGRRVVVWGSGGKGTSFLNSLDSALAVPYIVDINPNRQGRHIGGSAQQVVAPEFLLEFQPEIIIITNPLYEQEIKDQVAALGMTCEFIRI